MTQLKICGHRNEQDVATISPWLDEIDHVGFIFTPKSARYVRSEQVATWLERHPKLVSKAVGVFLNQSVTEIKNVLDETGIQKVQLHGEEQPEQCRALKKAACDLQIWKVFHINKGEHAADPWLLRRQLEPYVGVIDGLLLDTKVKGQWGGTGQTFDWSVIPEVQQTLAQVTPQQTATQQGTSQQTVPQLSTFQGDRHLPIMVAGGITSYNVQALLEKYAVDGIDVASGVERNDQKNPAHIEALIKGVKSNVLHQ